MNNWYKIFRMAEKQKERDYSWVSIAVPKTIASKTIKFAESIPERELYIEKEKEGEIIHGKGWKYGVEDDPHITVLGGIHTKDVKKILKTLDMYNLNITIRGEEEPLTDARSFVQGIRDSYNFGVGGDNRKIRQATPIRIPREIASD